MKYKVIFLLYLVASTQALNCPDFSNCQNGGSRRLKRDAGEEIHSIDVRKIKEKLVETYYEVKPLLENILEEAAPSIHEKISTTYLPALLSFRDEVMPFFNAKVLPQVQKYYKFGLTIAEKLVEKSYRSYKMSNSTHLAVISVSDLVDEVQNEVKPILEMARYLSARMMVQNGHYRGKRHVSDISENLLMNDHEGVHIIDIQKLKDKLIEAYHTIKPLLEDMTSEIAPSVYEKFVLTYLPKFQEIRNDVLPFVQSKIYPQLQKYVRFGMSIAEKLTDKAFRSYYLSNSTHINIVSISDIIEEVHAEMKPILDLGKYLSMRMAMNGQHYRGKRDLSEVSEPTLVRHKRQVPEFVFTMMSPFIEDIFRYVSNTFFAGSNDLLSKVFIPFIIDIMNDPESNYDVQSLWMMAKACFSPVLLEMAKSTYNTPEGTVIQIPRHFYDNAWHQLRIQSEPIVTRLMHKHLASFFKYGLQNHQLFSDIMLQFMFEKYDGADVMLDQFYDFVAKHRSLLKTSTNAHVHFYPLKEMMDDLVPLKISAAKVLIQYLRRNPNSWLNQFFGEKSMLQTLIDGTPVYAKPATTVRPYVAPPKKYGNKKYAKPVS